MRNALAVPQEDRVARRKRLAQPEILTITGLDDGFSEVENLEGLDNWGLLVPAGQPCPATHPTRVKGTSFVINKTARPATTVRSIYGQALRTPISRKSFKIRDEERTGPRSTFCRRPVRTKVGRIRLSELSDLSDFSDLSDLSDLSEFGDLGAAGKRKRGTGGCPPGKFRRKGSRIKRGKMKGKFRKGACVKHFRIRRARRRMAGLDDGDEGSDGNIGDMGDLGLDAELLQIMGSEGLGALKRKRRKSKAGKKRRRMSGIDSLGLNQLVSMNESELSNLAMDMALGDPILGGFDFLFSMRGLESIIGLHVGENLGFSLARLGQSAILMKAEDLGAADAMDRARKDPIGNILGDLVGAVIGYEIGRAVHSIPFAEFAMIGSATRYIGEQIRGLFASAVRAIGGMSVKNITPMSGVFITTQPEDESLRGTEGLGLRSDKVKEAAEEPFSGGTEFGEISQEAVIPEQQLLDSEEYQTEKTNF